MVSILFSMLFCVFPSIAFVFQRACISSVIKKRKKFIHHLDLRGSPLHSAQCRCLGNHTWAHPLLGMTPFSWAWQVPGEPRWPVCPWARLPEVVAGVQGLIGYLVVQAAEPVLWTAVVGPAVQVAVPVDLNAHDAALRKTTRGDL